MVLRINVLSVSHNANSHNAIHGNAVGCLISNYGLNLPHHSTNAALTSQVLLWLSGKFLGIDYAMLPNCEWNQKQKHKKQPWNKVECFAFGGATVCFASLETSFHAAKHTIPPPPSYEGYPLCPKDKNRSPFHGEKPLIIKWFLGKKPHQISQTILHGRDAILASATNWWFNMILQLWADVKYHVPTGFFRRRREVFYVFVSVPPVFFHWTVTTAIIIN